MIAPKCCFSLLRRFVSHAASEHRPYFCSLWFLNQNFTPLQTVSLCFRLQMSCNVCWFTRQKKLRDLVFCSNIWKDASFLLFLQFFLNFTMLIADLELALCFIKSPKSHNSRFGFFCNSRFARCGGGLFEGGWNLHNKWNQPGELANLKYGHE